jgi:para-nitrobenzyl esterase
MTYFASDADFELDEAGMFYRVRNLVGEDNARDVVATYREANPEAPPWEIYFLIFSDTRYVMPSITIAERRAALSGGPTRLYYLTWESPGNEGRILSPHTLDIPFIFDNVRSHPLTAGSESAIVLADKISDSIIGFAKNGNPDVGKLPDWTAYDSASRATMVWNDSSQVINDPIRAQREIMQPILNL